MGQYSIKELEKFSGIKAHTIRIWEQRYNLLAPQRTATNIRYYDDEQLKYLLNVVLLLKNGYRISQVSSFGSERLVKELKNIHSKAGQVHSGWKEAGINGFIKSMIDFDEEAFNMVYANAVQKHGLEKTVLELLYPFLERLGIMWTTGQINPAHEHFVCNLIRHKLVSAIEGLPTARVGPPFILCLPEGEFHEIGLLVAHYLLKKKSQKVLYLGQNLPISCMSEVVREKNPACVLSFLVNPGLKNSALGVVNEMLDACKGAKLLIALPSTHHKELGQKDGVFFLHSMEELHQFV